MIFNTRPRNVNLAGTVITHTSPGWIPIAFDILTCGLAGDLGIRTTDGRDIVLTVVAGESYRVSGQGIYPNGVAGTTVLNTAKITVS